MAWAVNATGLTKTYGETKALAGLSLQIPKGSIYGILGPNGAGKTTTIRILATLATQTSGEATVLGHDVRREGNAIRQKIALTGQFASVDEELTGKENLVMVCRLLGLSRKVAKQRAAELLEAFDLADAADKLVTNYSGGMRRKLDIASSLAVTPQLIFLDEPTTGLDPRSRNQVWDIVRQIAKAGTTVVLTTQYLEEADKLADRLAVIDHGKVIAEGTSSELKAMAGGKSLHVQLLRKQDASRATDILGAALGVAVIDDGRGGLSATLADDKQVPEGLTKLRRAKIPVGQYSVGAPSLDEVFFALTGKPAEVQE